MDAETPSRQKLYLLSGCVSLALMGLFWSLDSSIVYVTAGSAVFFFFLYFYNKPATRKEEWKHHVEHRTPSRSARREKDLINDLKEAFTKNPPKQPSGVNGAKFIGIVVMIIFSFFLFLTFASDDSYEDADMYYQAAEQFRWSGEFDSANVYYVRALNVGKSDIETLMGYGNSLMQKGEYDTALSTFDVVLAMDSNHEDARYAKALTYHFDRQFDRSQKEVFQLLDRYADNTDAFLLSGDNYYVQNRYDSAIYWYEAGYNAGQRTGILCYIMAYIYDSKGKRDRAIELYKEAIGIDSTLFDVYVRLGELFPGPDGILYRTKADELREAGYE